MHPGSTTLRSPCPRCRKQVLPAAVFCPRCGVALKAAGVSSAAAPVVIPKPIGFAPPAIASTRTLPYRTPAKYLPGTPKPVKRASSAGLWVFVLLGVMLTKFLAGVGNDRRLSTPPRVSYPSYRPPAPYVMPRVTPPTYRPAPQQIYPPGTRDDSHIERRIGRTMYPGAYPTDTAPGGYQYPAHRTN